MRHDKKTLKSILTLFLAFSILLNNPLFLKVSTIDDSSTPSEAVGIIEPVENDAYNIRYLDVDVEVGDRKASGFKTSLNIRRWDGECLIALNFPTIAGVSKIEDGKVKWESPYFDFHYYAVRPRTENLSLNGQTYSFLQNEMGGFEFEVILKQKPPSYAWAFPINTKGLVFHYQPPLHPDHPTWDDDGAIRPENVVGSYAVYYDIGTNIRVSKEDAEKYRCGKAFHIYRPYLVDALGAKAWADLNITDGILTITLPKEFLDKATYPIRMDPTFGYESQGGSWQALGSRISGSYFTGDSGIANSITAYTAPGGPGNFKYKYALYDKADNSLIGYTIQKNDNNAGWLTLTFPTEPTISAIDYYIVAWGNIPFAPYCKLIKYDDETGKGAYDDEIYNGFPETLDPTIENKKYSIYCTYTEGAGPIYVTLNNSLMISNTLTEITKYRKFLAQKLQASIGASTLKTLILSMGTALQIDVTLSKVYIAILNLGQLLTFDVTSSILPTWIRILSQTFNVESMFQTSFLFVNTLGQTIQFSDLAGKFHWIFRDAAQEISLAFKADTLLSIFTTLQQGLKFKIETSFLTTFFRELSESLQVESFASPLLTMVANVKQQFNALIKVDRFHLIVRSIAQKITAEIKVSALRNIFQTVSQTLDVQLRMGRVMFFVETLVQDLKFKGLAETVQSWVAELSQQISFSQQYSAVLLSFRALAQELRASISSSTLRSIILSIGEALRFNVAESEVYSWIVGMDQSLSVESGISYFYRFFSQVAQSLRVESGASPVAYLFTYVSETLNVDSLMSQIVTFRLSLGQGLGIQAIADALYATVVDLSQELSLTFSTTTLRTVFGDVGQALNVQAQATRVYTFIMKVGESFKLDVGAAKMLSMFVKTLQDFTVSTGTETFRTVFQTLTQTLNVKGISSTIRSAIIKVYGDLGISSSASTFFKAIISKAQSLNFNQSWDTYFQFFRETRQSLTFNASTSRTYHLFVYLSETLKANLSVSRLHQAFVSTAQSLRLKSLADTFQKFVQGLDQKISVTTSASTLRTFVESMRQSLTMRASLTITLVALITAFQNINIASIAKPFLSAFRNIGQSLRVDSVMNQVRMIPLFLAETLKFNYDASQTYLAIRNLFQNLAASPSVSASSLREIFASITFSVQSSTEGFYIIGVRVAQAFTFAAQKTLWTYYGILIQLSQGVQFLHTIPGLVAKSPHTLMYVAIAIACIALAASLSRE